MEYIDFIEHKRVTVIPSGIDVRTDQINKNLFDYQRDIVRWALAKGKAALFEGCGLGKTLQMLEWARHVHEYTGKPILILAPLSVAPQTVAEGIKFGITAKHCAQQSDVVNGINVTNYEKLDHFDASAFGGIVLDESSIIKSFTGKIKTKIFEAFKDTPFKLACTATPSPNDYMELANHAEFLGIMPRGEMLAMFFVHDGKETSKWRLKGHARDEYWLWVATWAVMMQNPDDLGYDGSKFNLTPLNITQHAVITGKEQVHTLTEQRKASKETLEARVNLCADAVYDDLINDANKWVIWCNLNAEQEMLEKVFKGLCVSISGSDSNEKKIEREKEWREGSIPILITKPKCFGFGLNWQHCNNMAFVGLSHSFEAYYQAVRRCWRFGQENEVNVHVITSDMEGAIVENIQRKEEAFNFMLSGMISATQEITKANIESTKRMVDDYLPTEPIYIPSWLMSETA